MHARRGMIGRWSVVWGLLFCIAVTITISGCPPRRDRTGLGSSDKGIHVRAIWVTRWDYKNKGDIVRIMDNCRDAGFNTVLFQVRGRAAAFYRSRIEPWDELLGGRDPGFDPLSVACDEARKRGLRIHAWANVMPAWRGKKPPKNQDHVFYARRDWFWRDEMGAYQPMGWYLSLNPCYPEVREYLVAVMHEIVNNYPVDGLHLDYIRFPNEWNASYPSGTSVPDYPRDTRTLRLFYEATGETPDSSPKRWRDWRTQQVNLLVRDISNMIQKTKPRVLLSAAVGASPATARKEHFQDARYWIDQRLIDVAFPMNYADSLETYRVRLTGWKPHMRKLPIVTGIMFDKRKPALVRRQLDEATTMGGHFAAFAYNSLFERLDAGGQPLMDGQSMNRAALRREVIPHIRQLAMKKP